MTVTEKARCWWRRASFFDLPPPARLALASILAASLSVPSFAVAAEGEADGADRLPRIAVLHFSAPVADEWWLSRGDGAARDIFSRHLEATGLFEVVEREELDRLAVEEGLSARGELTPATAVKAGRILGVDYVVGGALTEYSAVTPGLMSRTMGKLPGLATDQRTFVTAFSARLWEAKNGRMIWADALRVEAPISKARALELGEGDPDPAATFREALEPVLTSLAGRLATEPVLPPLESETENGS